MLVPRPGWAEHGALHDWWGDFVHLCQTLLAQSNVDPKAIHAVVTSAIGPCMLPENAAGTPLKNGGLYRVDGRASAEIATLNAALGEDAILGRAGNALTSQSVGPKILWLRRNHPDIWAKSATILTSTSFLVHRLTGQMVIDHHTEDSVSPLYDFDAQDWADDLAGICDHAHLPRLMWSTEIAGQITAKTARDTEIINLTSLFSLDCMCHAPNMLVWLVGRHGLCAELLLCRSWVAVLAFLRSKIWVWGSMAKVHISDLPSLTVPRKVCTA